MRADPASERCPRCGQGFHCGAKDSAPCPCSALSLPDALQQALRERYEGCLCLRCLQAVTNGESIDPPDPYTVSRRIDPLAQGG